MIDHGGKLLLPWTVGKRENQIPDGSIALLFPVIFIHCPFLIALHKILKPVADRLPAECLRETPDPFCFHIAIGHLYIDLRQVLILRHHIRIAHRLRLVDKYRLLPLPEIRIHSFDLIDHHPPLFPEDAVGTSLDLQGKFRSIFLALHILQRKQRDFRHIAGSHALLYLAVYSVSHLHCVCIRCTGSGRSQISLPEDELHQISYRYLDDFLFFFHNI